MRTVTCHNPECPDADIAKTIDIQAVCDPNGPIPQLFCWCGTEYTDVTTPAEDQTS